MNSAQLECTILFCTAVTLFSTGHWIGGGMTAVVLFLRARYG